MVSESGELRKDLGFDERSQNSPDLNERLFRNIM
jgi:hypothetical protein